ncbi:MAG: hypothetical protein M9939_22630 [Mesorhizobium sp.]|nr:hypothetical protein [Mesorhizobium sp.]MCO5163926.1 hypothetical protein [Mesorhizobium sp.]
MRRARFAGRPSGLQIPDEPLQINGDLLEDSAIQPAAIIRRATQEERLQLGDAIVQCISGNTGTPLASVAVTLGFKCLVFSNVSNEKKLSHMKTLGVDLELLRSDNKKITVKLVTALIETSRLAQPVAGPFVGGSDK